MHNQIEMNKNWIVDALRYSDCEAAKEICDGLLIGEIRLIKGSMSPCIVEKIRSINQFRMQNPKFDKSAHGIRLKRETFEFIHKSEKYKDQNLVMLNLEKDPNVIYGLYILDNSTEILGAIHYYDKTRTSDNDWKIIWGNTE